MKIPSQAPDAALAEATAREALRRAAAQLDGAERQHQPYAMSQALTALARAYRDLRALAAAEAAYAQALRWSHAAGAHDQAADLHAEMAETAVRELIVASANDDEQGPRGEPERDERRRIARAARERARDHAFEAARLAPRTSDAHWEVQILMRVSDVLEQCGDRNDAAQLHLRALRLLSGRPTAAADPHQLPGPGRLADH